MFRPADLHDHILWPSPGGTLWLALSGGLDSSVLLHATRQLLATLDAPPQLRAVHVNHGLHDAAAAWQAHCEHECRALALPLTVRQLHLEREQGGVESRARAARYAVFEELLEQGDVLLTAHHQDDQVETLMFRLLRGSGPQGLGAIPASRVLGRGRLCRPLLTVPRQALEAWARERKLDWVEDHSNRDTDFDRNYLRHQVLPMLEQRWPAYRDNLSRSATLLAESAQLLATLAAQDREAARGRLTNALDLQVLRAFDEPRQRNLLYHWIRELAGRHPLPAPNAEVLRRIVEEVMPAAGDAVPLVAWGRAERRAEIRRFQDQLYLLSADSRAPLPEVLNWRLDSCCELPGGAGRLELESAVSGGLDTTRLTELEVRFRRGGEFARPCGRRGKALKKLLQEYAVPPWLRDRVPLLYSGDQLVAVGDLFICAGWQSTAPGTGRQIRWRREDIRCGY